MNPDNLRNWLSSTAAELRERKWVLPVLLLLVIAAVAIPLVLAKSGKPATLEALPPAPVLTVPSLVTTPHHHVPRKSYLEGPAHNPFIVKTKPVKTNTTTTPTPASTGASTTAAASSSTDSSSPTQTTASVTCPSGTKLVTYKGEPFCVEHVCSAGSITADVDGRLACLEAGERCSAAYENGYLSYGYTCVSGILEVKTKVKTTNGPYSNYEVEFSVLQQGVSTTPTVFHNLERDQLLPSDAAPFGAFLGVRTDHRTAVFVLAENTSVVGEGRCAPSTSRCEFLTLEPGQVATLTVQPTGGSPSVFNVEFDKLTKVLSSGSTVAVDSTGAADIKKASGYIQALRTARYGAYTGLLTIDLGTTVPVAS